MRLVSIGNYHLTGNTLGKGTFARVEAATHVLLDTQVALKVIVKRKVKDPYMKCHMYREAHLLACLNHPNIVRILEICKSTEIFCMVLEYVSGGTLYDRVQRKGKLDEEEARGWSRQLVSAINYMHMNNVLHRDLKLENILLSGLRLVLADFGLSNFWYPGKAMRTHCGSAGKCST